MTSPFSSHTPPPLLTRGVNGTGDTLEPEIVRLEGVGRGVGRSCTFGSSRVWGKDHRRSSKECSGVATRPSRRPPPDPPRVVWTESVRVCVGRSLLTPAAGPTGTLSTTGAEDGSGLSRIHPVPSTSESSWFRGWGGRGDRTDPNLVPCPGPSPDSHLCRGGPES